jgi:2-iminobutanoate/2-iminopropanoate deaminase
VLQRDCRTYARNLTRSVPGARSPPPLRPSPIAGDPRRRVDFLLWHGAVNPETGEREHGTLTSEARRIFENLKLLLESAGSSLDRLVQVHAMIYDRIEYDVLNRLYRQYVPNAPPARTVMSVQIEAGFKVMLDVIAAA